MDSREAQDQISVSYQLQAALAESARKQNAERKPTSGAGTTQGSIPAIEQMGHSAGVVAGVSNDGGTGGRRGRYSAAHLQMSSPAGIAAMTPAHAILTAGRTGNVSVGEDINLLAQGNAFAAVVEGISLFTFGTVSNKDKPNQEAGIALHAASGKVTSQSQSDATRLTADKAVTVASTTKTVTIAAPNKHVLMTAQGAALKLDGGNITIQAPGKVEFKASTKELAGPANGSAGAPAVPKAKQIYNEAFVVLDEETKAPMAHVRYRIESASGAIVEGVTDALGRTQRMFTSTSETLTLHLPKEE
jgi:type VI secretion system secreted protein VgrG